MPHNWEKEGLKFWWQCTKCDMIVRWEAGMPPNDLKVSWRNHPEEVSCEERTVILVDEE